MCPSPQAGYRTVPSPQGSVILSFYSHFYLFSTLLSNTFRPLICSSFPSFVISKMLCKWNMVCNFLGLAFFTWHNFFKIHPTLNISIVSFLLFVSSIPWYWCTTVCLIAHPLKDIWIAWLWQILVLWTFVYMFLSKQRFFIFLVYLSRVQLPGVNGKCMSSKTLHINMKYFSEYL